MTIVASVVSGLVYRGIDVSTSNAAMTLDQLDVSVSLPAELPDFAGFSDMVRPYFAAFEVDKARLAKESGIIRISQISKAWGGTGPNL